MATNIVSFSFLFFSCFRQIKGINYSVDYPSLLERNGIIRVMIFAQNLYKQKNIGMEEIRVMIFAWNLQMHKSIPHFCKLCIPLRLLRALAGWPLAVCRGTALTTVRVNRSAGWSATVVRSTTLVARNRIGFQGIVAYEPASATKLTTTVFFHGPCHCHNHRQH